MAGFAGVDRLPAGSYTRALPKDEE